MPPYMILACLLMVTGLGTTEAGNVAISNRGRNPINYSCYGYLKGTQTNQDLGKGTLNSGASKNVGFKDNKDFIRCELSMPSNARKFKGIQIIDSRQGGSGDKVTAIRAEDNDIVYVNHGFTARMQW